MRRVSPLKTDTTSLWPMGTYLGATVTSFITCPYVNEMECVYGMGFMSSFLQCHLFPTPYASPFRSLCERYARLCSAQSTGQLRDRCQLILTVSDHHNATDIEIDFWSDVHPVVQCPTARGVVRATIERAQTSDVRRSSTPPFLYR